MATIVPLPPHRVRDTADAPFTALCDCWAFVTDHVRQDYDLEAERQRANDVGLPRFASLYGAVHAGYAVLSGRPAVTV